MLSINGYFGKDMLSIYGYFGKDMLSINGYFGKDMLSIKIVLQIVLFQQCDTERISLYIKYCMVTM